MIICILLHYSCLMRAEYEQNDRSSSATTWLRLGSSQRAANVTRAHYDALQKFNVPSNAVANDKNGY